MSLACPSDPLPISISSDVCLTVVLFHVEAAYSIQAYGSSVLDMESWVSSRPWSSGWRGSEPQVPYDRVVLQVPRGCEFLVMLQKSTSDS